MMPKKKEKKKIMKIEKKRTHIHTFNAIQCSLFIDAFICMRVFVFLLLSVLYKRIFLYLIFVFSFCSFFHTNFYFYFLIFVINNIKKKKKRGIEYAHACLKRSNIIKVRIHSHAHQYLLILLISIKHNFFLFFIN